ncbi:MAG: hypothetical protein PHC86_00365 [Eubacteriales bacterium]|nr:hypothetical protein [Eubacteriales bacterium]
MRPENDMMNDAYIDEIRDAGVLETSLVARLGFYRAADVDRYINNLQNQLSSAETVYMDRFEELRSSLLAMTRERDEKIQNNRELDKKLAAAQDLPSLLSSFGQVGVSILEYEQLKKDVTVLTAEVAILTDDLKQSKTESALLKEEVVQAAIQNPDKTALVEELQQARKALQTRMEEIHRLSVEIQNQRQYNIELGTELEALQLSVATQAELSAQTRTQYQLLDTQYQIGQDMINKLMLEKTALENELKNQEQRWDIQREALINRFQSILNSQSQFLKKLQENFNASVTYMENLNETGLRGFTER